MRSLNDRHAEERISLNKQVASILRENPDLDLRPVTGATPAGDEMKLRGIPALGRGVGGAIRGTRPGDRITLSDPSRYHRA